MNYGNGQSVRYVYDALDRVSKIQYNTNGGSVFATAYEYTYAAAGNITKKRVYAYTEGTLPANSLDEINYSYGDSTWKDLLTEYDGTEIEYDEIGNPIQIGEYTLEWTQGRRLDRYYVDGAESIEFTYNADGIRTSKTIDGYITHYYMLDGSTILSEEWIDGGDQHLMVYVYDANGSPTGYRYRNSYYSEGEFDSFLYKKNLQGDITGIYGTNGTCYATYVYDAWGNFTVTYQNGAWWMSAVHYNPFAYRGYYYDAETGLYYLNSRYYNPQWGRFLNADCYLNANGDILGFNMFAYCGNNPVMGYDPSGELALVDDAIIWGGLALITLIILVVEGPQIVSTVDEITKTVYRSAVNLGENVSDFLTSLDDKNEKIGESKSAVPKRAGPKGKPGRKKQGREVNEKKRKNGNFKSRSNKDPNRPMKKHTPGRDHRDAVVFWNRSDDSNNYEADIWWGE